jgi:hypothetical protein
VQTTPLPRAAGWYALGASAKLSEYPATAARSAVRPWGVRTRLLPAPLKSTDARWTGFLAARTKKKGLRRQGRPGWYSRAYTLLINVLRRIFLSIYRSTYRVKAWSIAPRHQHMLVPIHGPARWQP